VCTAILFGVDSIAIEDSQFDFSQPQDDDSIIAERGGISRNGADEEQHRARQRQGPKGKLHDLVTHIKTNNTRIRVFESKQSEATIADEAEKILRLVTNGGIRCKSTYLMIERGIRLKDALTLYQRDEESIIHKADLLTKDD
jgi:DNA invertase Pin-like site-specific DNA recombinase